MKNYEDNGYKVVFFVYVYCKLLDFVWKLYLDDNWYYFDWRFLWFIFKYVNWFDV